MSIYCWLCSSRRAGEQPGFQGSVSWRSALPRLGCKSRSCRAGRMRGYGRLWGCSWCLQGSGLWVPGHRVRPLGTSPLTTHRSTMPKFTGEETHGAARGADVLLMEMHLPLLLFAPCRNCAKPQRQEPKKGSASSRLPPHHRAWSSPPVPNRNPAPGALFCCSLFVDTAQKEEIQEGCAVRVRPPSPGSSPHSPTGTGAFGNWPLFLMSLSFTFICELCQRFSMVGAVGRSLHCCLYSVF